MAIMRNMFLFFFCSHIVVNLLKLTFSLHSPAKGGRQLEITHI